MLTIINQILSFGVDQFPSYVSLYLSTTSYLLLIPARLTLVCPSEYVPVGHLSNSALIVLTDPIPTTILFVTLSTIYILHMYILPELHYLLAYPIQFLLA